MPRPAEEPPLAPAPAPASLALEPVRRLRLPSPAALAALVRAGEPVIVEGAMGGARAVGRWSPAALRARVGDMRVKTYVIPEGHILLDPRTGFRVEEMTVADYVDHVASGAPPRYYLRAPLESFPREMRGEVPVPAYCRGALRLRSNLWFSAPDTVSHLHFDLPHNLIAQLYGRKRFILYPFRERKNLYPFSPLSSVPHLSRVDLERLDARRFPRVERARGWSCELVVGDLLLLPSRTWHHARSLGASVSVNFWWPPLSMLPLVIASDLYKRVRGLHI